MTQKITRRQSLGKIISAFSLPLVAASSQLFVPENAYSLEPRETEMILKRNYAEREAQWKNNLERQSRGEILIDQTSIKPSQDYDLDSQITVLGSIWDAIPEERKAKTARVWNNTRPEPNRRSIWMIYQNPFRYFRDRLTDDQKSEFNHFNAACSYAVKEFENPEMAIFESRDGSATKHYFEHFPWITLRLPSVPDRMLMYRQEYLDNAAPNRINQANIDKFSSIAMQGLR